MIFDAHWVNSLHQSLKFSPTLSNITRNQANLDSRGNCISTVITVPSIGISFCLNIFLHMIIKLMHIHVKNHIELLKNLQKGIKLYYEVEIATILVLYISIHSL